MAARKPKKKKDTSFATWKFELENTVNADPRLGPACLGVVRAYLDWMRDQDATPWLSIGALSIATSMAENTLRQARRQLEKEGYFVPAGKSSSGAIMYRIINSGLNRVLDHVTIARETLREIEAEKKAVARIRRATGPSKSEGDLSPSKSEVLEADVPFKTRRDSPSESEPNTVYNTVEAISSEREGSFSTPPLDVQTSYSLAHSGDEANEPLPVPDSAYEAECMIATICEGYSVLPVIQKRMTSMLMAGALSPNLAMGIIGARKEDAA